MTRIMNYRADRYSPFSDIYIFPRDTVIPSSAFDDEAMLMFPRRAKQHRRVLLATTIPSQGGSHRPTFFCCALLRAACSLPSGIP